MPAKEPKREFKGGDKIRVNLHRGKIEDAAVRAVIQHNDGWTQATGDETAKAAKRTRKNGKKFPHPARWDWYYGFTEKLTGVFSGR